MGNPISGQAKAPNFGQYARGVSLAGIRINRNDDADTLNTGALLTTGLYGGRYPGGTVLISTPPPGATPAASILPPWWPFITGSSTFEANFYPGTVAGILATGLTGIALSAGDLNYIWLAMTATAGVVTGATVTAGTTYPGLAAATSGTPPTSFNIPIAIFDLTGSKPVCYNIVGFGNIWAQPYVSILDTINTAALLTPAFTPWFNWEWGASD